MRENQIIKRIINLGSSSEGNAFYIEINREGYVKPFGLLIECGFPYETLTKKLLNNGISVNDINAVLVTHEHNDHSQSVKDLINAGVRVFAPMSVFIHHNVLEKVEKRNIITEFVEKVIGDQIKVLGLPLNHISSNGEVCYNLGYIITINDSFRIAFFTDTKQIDWDLSNFQFDIIFIEANNKTLILKFGLKNAEEKNNMGKLAQYKRVLQSHMTVERTGKTLQTFDLSKTKVIFLTHLTSDRKKNEREFIQIVKDYLVKSGKKKIPLIKVADHRGNFIG